MSLELLNEFINDVKDDNVKSIQSVINKHFTLLNTSNKLYTWVTILDYINEQLAENKKISKTTFMQSIFRARIKFNNSIIQTPPVNSPTPTKYKGDYVTPRVHKTHSKPEIKDVKIESKTSSNRINEWAIKCNVKRERLINDLETFDLTPDEVKSWNLPNENLIRNKLAQLQERESEK